MTNYKITSVDVVQEEDRRVSAVKINLKEVERHNRSIVVTIPKKEFDRMMKNEKGAAELLKLLDERCRHEDEAIDYELEAEKQLVEKMIMTDDRKWE